MLESTRVIELEITADDLVARLLQLAARETVCILDSCGVGHLGSHLLLAGINPVEVVEIKDAGDDGTPALATLNGRLGKDLVGFFTLSYEFGLKLLHIPSAKTAASPEPDIFLALFDQLIIHDYTTGKTYAAGQSPKIDELLNLRAVDSPVKRTSGQAAHSDFDKDEYVAAVETIRDRIRSGDTYQTNLTQQITVPVLPGHGPDAIFRRLRDDHPAPFAAYFTRSASTVVSASPERFFRVDRGGFIEASPIKGTWPRGSTVEEDRRLRSDLESSEKDRAENTMIVDLMRNDLGRICDYGSVLVEKLCDVEEHPTLFHLVSTIRGKLRPGLEIGNILEALFPCGSITGAPKISTMQIIDAIERSPRGLSMGAIGIYIPPELDLGPVDAETVLDLSVAIRTIVVRGDQAVFNVGGGVVIDSDAEKEFDESLLKARALLSALNARVP